MECGRGWPTDEVNGRVVGAGQSVTVAAVVIRSAVVMLGVGSGTVALILLRRMDVRIGCLLGGVVGRLRRRQWRLRCRRT